MVRPRDLPQPVRHHAAHENPADRHRCAPGPGAYHNHAQTSQSMARTGRSFSKADRFRRTHSTQLDLLSVHPGPCYNPVLHNSRLAVSFKGGPIGQRSSSAASRSDMNVPGPGAYELTSAVPLSESASAPAISFTKDIREHRSRGGGGSTPGPGAYDVPTKPFGQKQSTFIGTSRRTELFRGDDLQDAGPSGPSHASLAAMDKAMDATRPPVTPQIRFPTSSRSGAAASGKGDPSVGPGQYSAYDTYTRPNSRGTGFGRPSSAVGRMNHLTGPSSRLGGSPVAFSSMSTKSTAPASSFSKAPRSSSLGGGGVGADNTMGPAYNATYTHIDAQVKLCVPWKAPVRPSSASNARGGGGDGGYGGAGPQYMEPRSTLSGPAIAFTKAKRQGVHPNGVPGPGTYLGADDTRRRPDSASQSIGRALRNFDIVHDDGSTGGAGGSGGGDIMVGLAHTRPTSAAVSFPRASRVGRPASAPAQRDQGPSGLEYTPCYSQLDRNSHGAILYLTG
ncbi:Hypothetical protein, putative [Bodo saltans]|uniref:Uncharacterized protein n=1 Tax=Bodo saltans TaxID=75058 RepID=A0A0S4J3N7_BODSA|nr:Hypothetical protein, putative [Bodo saltans]|eukprot:CUG72707.1 Hypothetical protein, putative [Bodo saltans]